MKGGYWSSTSWAPPNTNTAWIVLMWDGSLQEGGKASSYYEYVWPVRGGQSGSLGNLTVWKDGAGTGTVVSRPAGINCDLTNTACNAYFPFNTVVTLSATPAQDGSIFTGFSGDSDCSDGQITISGDISCTATFDQCLTKPADLDGTPYDSIEAAYLAASSISNDLIKLVAYNRVETVDFSTNKNITLKGGYDCSLTWQAWLNTIITGTLTISDGSLTIENIVIQ